MRDPLALDPEYQRYVRRCEAVYDHHMRRHFFRDAAMRRPDMRQNKFTRDRRYDEGNDKFHFSLPPGQYESEIDDDNDLIHIHRSEDEGLTHVCSLPAEEGRSV